MLVDKTLKKEKDDTEKEERWLLQEIEFLDKFNRDISEILILQEKLSSFHESAEKEQTKKLQEKLEALKYLIYRDEDKFKRFRRILERGERRRIRYEKRVLGRIEVIERFLDTPNKKFLDNLVEQVHVYSARILTELSWRVGKISSLTSQKQPNINLIKKHLDTTIESSKALVLLLERLQGFIKSIESNVRKKELTKSILPDIYGLSGYLREGAIKTAVIKSIPDFQELLEKKVNESEYQKYGYFYSRKIKEELLSLIQQHQENLLHYLSPEDLRQLQEVGFEVPKNSVLLFLPDFPSPILVFNIKQIPHFQERGWVSHALTGENLERVSRDSFIRSPIEVVHKTKHFHSPKFWANVTSGQGRQRRLMDGISFSFQEYMKYQSYMYGFSHNLPDQFRKELKDKMGGLFIFSLGDILKPGLLLDFQATMDGYSEVCLRNESYYKENPLVVSKSLVSLRAVLPQLLGDFREKEKFFTEARKRIDLFEKILEFLRKNPGNMLPRVEIGEDKIVVETIERSEETKWEFKAKSRMTLPFDPLLSEFWEDYRRYFNDRSLPKFIDILKDNGFLEFILPWWEFADNFSLLLSTFAPGEAPRKLNGTILQVGNSYSSDENIDRNHEIYCTLVFAILTLIKKSPPTFKSSWSTNDYLNYGKKLTPNQVKNLLKQTVKELSTALEKITGRLRTKFPCIVLANSGLLLLPGSMRDKDTLQRLIWKKVPIFSQFPHGESKIDGTYLGAPFMDFIFSAVVPINKLPLGERQLRTGYIFLKDDKVTFHSRETGKEMRIN